MPDQVISTLLTMIDQAFDHKSWHGTNLNGSIRSVTAQQAAWRPYADRHNIWEIAVHAAYWKYTVLRRLLDEPRGSFPLKGSNWFERSGADETAWKSDVVLLRQTHKRLRDVIAQLSESELADKPAGSKVSNLDLVTGIAAHDLYHAGQIQLLKRLQSKA